MPTRSLLIAAAVGCTLVATNGLSAQVAETQGAPERKPRWEFLVPAGTVVPTGAQRDVIKRGNLTAAQLSYVVRPALAVTATLGWARSRDLAAVGEPKLDLFTYDVGAEARAPGWIGGGAITVSPFAGVGAGARSYNHRSLDVDATHNLAAYGSAGAELGIRRVRLRLEVRDYVTGFRPLDGVGAARTGNDVVVMAGLRLVRR
jgi:hypothetical protein